MTRIVFLILFISLITSCKSNNMQLNDSISEREAMGFSNTVKNVFVEGQYEYTFDKQGNLIKRIRKVERYTWYNYYTYKSGLLVEEISLWSYRQYINYEYNEQKQLIKKQVYKTVPYFYFDSIGNMYSSYDSSRLDLKQNVKEGKLKLREIITYTYNNNSKLIKKKRSFINYYPVSPSSDITTRYSYNKNGQLKKEVKKAPRSRVSKTIETYKYNDYHQKVFRKRILRRRWYNILFNREVSKYFYTYDSNKRLIKSWTYDESNYIRIISIKEYKYNSTGQLYEKWSYSVSITKYGKIDVRANTQWCQKIQYNSLGDIEETTSFNISLKENVLLPNSLVDINSSYFNIRLYSPGTKYIYEYF